MIEIIADDVRFVPCDMLILKYAQGFHGADALVAETLRLPAKTRMPRPSEFIVIESHGSVSATRVLFFGVVPPNYLEYREIREFTRSALKAVSKLFQGFSSARRVAMTIHGVGYGLDEREAFLAQLGGIADALHGTSSELHISIVERDAERADRLREILNESWSPQPSEHVAVSKQGGLYPPIRAITAGDASRSKPHIFVAMPFGKSFKDVYRFGIQDPVNKAGYLCERVDMISFMGDILDRIKTRIETSHLVIADLTEASANVYLEVGYAWGKGRPTLLLVNESAKEDLKFDVRGQRCIAYEDIGDLAEKLDQELAILVAKP